VLDVSWTPELALHHELLDRQHAELFRLLVAAAAALRTGLATKVEQAVEAFTAAMQEHAAVEEAIMEESLFPERGRHRVAHEVFLTDLERLRTELRSSGPSLNGDWIVIRLPEWLRFHIAMNDAPLGVHLARRPAAPAPARAARRRYSRTTS
jgi:hemerythrin